MQCRKQPIRLLRDKSTAPISKFFKQQKVLIFFVQNDVDINRYSHFSNNSEVTLTGFEKKFQPPRLLISQLFSTLHSSFIAVMFQFFPTIPMYLSSQIWKDRHSITEQKSIFFGVNKVMYKCMHRINILWDLMQNSFPSSRIVNQTWNLYAFSKPKSNEIVFKIGFFENLVVFRQK